MNIFATSDVVAECAIMLDDKRLNKMTIETAQMLSTAVRARGGYTQYKPTHAGHPCTQWAAANQANYKWLLGLFRELLAEYSYRYGRTHGCTKVLNELAHQTHLLPDGAIQPHPNCSLFKKAASVHVAYRATMVYKWGNLDKNPKWTKREKPSWYKDYVKIIKPTETIDA